MNESIIINSTNHYRKNNSKSRLTPYFFSNSTLKTNQLMKLRAILPLFLMLLSLSMFGQLVETTVRCEGHEHHVEYDASLTQAEIDAHIEAVKADYRSYLLRTSADIVGLYPSVGLNRDACSNGGFENGYNAWTGLSLRHSSSPLPIENGLTNNPGIAPLPFTGTASGTNFTNIETAGNDPVLAVATPPVTMSRLAPMTTGSNSLRLGNDQDGWGAEGVAKRFLVTNDNWKYYFQYAIVMDISHSNTDGTVNGTEAFFIAEAIDAAGNSIDQVIDVANPANPFIQSTNEPNWAFHDSGTVFYRDWRCTYLDLSSHIGQEVMVYFVNADCSAGAHKGYTYLDDVCVTCDDDEGEVTIDVATDSCIVSDPFNIGGTFDVPTGATNVSLSLEIWQGNALQNTLTGPTIGLGGTYNFSLSATDFPSANAGDCYDIVAVLQFDFPDMNGNPVTVTKLSSKAVNGVQDGETPGLDNDVCFCDPCWELQNNPDFTWNIDYGALGADLTITDISTTLATDFPYITVDFGDGSPIVTLGPGSTYTHSYANYGTYQVCLTMYTFIDDICCHDTVCYTITVDPPECEDIEADFNVLYSPFSCAISVSHVSTYTPSTVVWDWGDGTPFGSGVNATHTYASGGTYEVVMYVTYHPPWNPKLCCYVTVKKTIRIRCGIIYYPFDPIKLREVPMEILDVEETSISQEEYEEMLSGKVDHLPGFEAGTQEADISLIAAPNPAYNQVRIKANASENVQGQIIIYGLNGAVMKQINAKTNLEVTINTMDLRNLLL